MWNLSKQKLNVVSYLNRKYYPKTNGFQLKKNSTTLHHSLCCNTNLEKKQLLFFTSKTKLGSDQKSSYSSFKSSTHKTSSQFIFSLGTIGFGIITAFTSLFASYIFAEDKLEEQKKAEKDSIEKPTYRFSNGNYYFGPINSNSVPHGEGLMIEPYFETQAGIFGGKMFKGEFKNGTVEGIGTLMLPDGTTFHGHFENGEIKSGFQIFDGKKTKHIEKTASIFPKTFSHKKKYFWDRPIREITYISPKNQKKGNVYEGTFSDFKPDGKGTAILADGECKYNGNFSEGKRSGYGVGHCTNPQLISEGIWSNDGIQSGSSTFVISEDRKFVFVYKNAKLEAVLEEDSAGHKKSVNESVAVQLIEKTWPITMDAISDKEISKLLQKIKLENANGFVIDDKQSMFYGGIYEGDMKAGKPHGVGKITSYGSKSGPLYEGQWFEGVFVN